MVLKRILPSVRPGSRIIVINDEAHHCYYPREKGERTEDGNTEEENKHAMWFTGLREIAARYKLNAVYDLSATPYYLEVPVTMLTACFLGSSATSDSLRPLSLGL